MIKKLSIFLTVVLVLAFALTGCKKAGAGKKFIEVTDMGGIADASFNEMAWKGLEKAKADLGVDIKYIESKQQADYEVNINAAGEEGADLIIPVGFLLTDAAYKAAAANPTAKYAGVDISAKPELTNFRGNTAKMDQACFLAGYLAAGMTKTGKVGTYVGILFPSTQVFMDGFYLGVQEYNKAHGTSVAVLGFDPAKPNECLQTGDFSNTDNGRKMAETLMDEGADIILPVAGPVGLGSAAVMQERGTGWLIGVDQDWSKSAAKYVDFILASAMKRIDVFVYDSVKQVVDGKFKGGEDYILDVKNGGVGLQYGSAWEGKIPTALKDEIKALATKIANGEIKTAP